MSTIVAATLGMIAGVAVDRWRNTPPPRPGV